MTSSIPPILTLIHMKSLRVAAGISAPQMAKLSAIPRARISVLESRASDVAEEPWFDEAVTIARSLGCAGIRPLIGVVDLHDIPLGYDPLDPVDAWRSGVRLPLSTACRIAVRTGLPDPLDLDVPLPFRQAWQILARGERYAQTCSWCGVASHAGEPHLPTCWMNNLLGPRNIPLSDLGSAPRTRRPGRRRIATTLGKGLRRTRERLGVTQERIATAVELHPAYYAKLEQCVYNLTLDVAEKIAVAFNVSVEELFTYDNAENTAELRPS